MTTDPKFTKAVSSTVFINKETKEYKTFQDSDLKWTLASRLDINDKKGNFFSSFNLPAESNYLVYTPVSAATEFEVASIVRAYPELLQFNVDQCLIAKIPSSGYSEFIDGRSFTIRIPNISGSSSSSLLSAWTLYSSVYERSKPDNYENSALLGDNIAYLFCDDINRPYSGMTIDDIGRYSTLQTRRTWNPNSNNYNDRPYAISYQNVAGYDLSLSGVDSDKRVRVNWAVAPPPNFPDKKGVTYRFIDTEFSGGTLQLIIPNHGFTTANIGTGITITIDKDNKYLNSDYDGMALISSVADADTINTDLSFGASSTMEGGTIYLGTGVHYNYDIPCGFVVLDKGYVVITHPKIINSLPWSYGFKTGSTFAYSTVANATDIYWTGSTASGDKANFIDYYDQNTVFKISSSCLALNNEFYISNNYSWDRNRLSQNGLANPQTVQITEVGLYNALGELVGIAKFSEPISKTFNDILGLEINIEL